MGSNGEKSRAASSEERDFRRLVEEFEAIQCRFRQCENLAERQELVRRAKQIVEESTNLIQQSRQKLD
jgi:hypothetical protein